MMDKFGCCFTVIQFLTHIKFCLIVADDPTKCEGKLIVGLTTYSDQGCMKLSSMTRLIITTIMVVQLD